MSAIFVVFNVLRKTWDNDINNMLPFMCQWSEWCDAIHYVQQ